MVRKKNIIVKKKRQIPSENYESKRISLNTKCTENFFIGKILLGYTLNFPPEKYLRCRLSILTAPEEVDKIHIEFDEISVLVTLLIDTEIIQAIVSAGIFSFNFSLNGQEFFMDIHFRSLPLSKFNKTVGICLKNLFVLTHHISIPEPINTSTQHLFGAQDISKLFKSLSSLKMIPCDLLSQNVQHPALKPELRPYQKDAVKWMLKQETVISEEDDIIHPLYTTLTIGSGMTIYLDKYSGYIVQTKPIIQPSYRGGILAEEMGLGKTVEFLALILNHPFKVDESEQKCIDSETQSCSKSNLQDSSSGISEKDNADIPIINKQPKKKSSAIKKIKLNEKNDDDVEYQAKDIRVPSDWVKNNKKKSDTYLALQLWYNSALSEVNHKPIRQRELIECVCGETYSQMKVKCINCGKFQHSHCLGYNKSLGEFRCPSCWLEHPLIATKATLIVTPISLRTQWCNEIKKHVDKGMKVLVYEGSNKSPVYPTYFKDFDIVITTYNILQSEFRLSDKGQVCELRRKRRYDYSGSPLSRIKWWRLCLDEAQTVETPGKIVSAMAKKLTAEYRWAVTGTPISKDISDLYGLIDYLQIEPYNDYETWTHLLYNPYLNGNTDPLCNFLSKIMWRSSKEEVIDQINIPMQAFHEKPLEFSAVEKFFYNKEHELSSEAFLNTLKNINTSVPLAKLDKSLLKKIMLPLLSLRQLCTHPNTMKGRYLASKKKVSTMKELLEALILKTSLECEEHLRLIVSSLNGVAGIHILMQNADLAVAEYRKVLQLSARFSDNKNESDLSIDKLQLIHTMHNLAELLDNHANVPPTLHDSTLRSDCKLLEQKYIKKFIDETLTAYQESNNYQDISNKLQEKFILNCGQWYSDGLDLIEIKNLNDELTNKIRNVHDVAQVKCPIEVTCTRVILLFVSKWDEDVTNSRADLIETINRLFTYEDDTEFKIFIDQKLVTIATDCHLRPEQKTTTKRKKCPLCLANDNLKKYEAKLFYMTKRTVTFEEMSLQGSWKPTSQELILKALYMLLRTKFAEESITKDGENHMTLLENLKKEFKELRKLWTYIYQQVAAQDELDMCKIRLRLENSEIDKNSTNSKNNALKRLSYILENKLDTIYMLNEHELDHHMMLLRSDEIKGNTNFEKTLGVKNYLQTLKKQQYEGFSPDPCPICHNTLGQHWSILSCGHNCCMDCIHKLLEQTLSLKIICCVCRQPQNVQDISYIRSGNPGNKSEDVEIKGNFSTKIEAIITFLLKLKADDENVKVLVFSSWLSVLKCLKDALIMNEIKCELLINSKLEDRIENFKDEKLKLTALLLPISLGGKGLNLTEATHVILTEPLLNPGDELQAVGRVHRIGQTRPTYVHKFYIKNTIEESILTATSENADRWDKNKVTLNQLISLFQREEVSAEPDSDLIQ